MVRPCAGGKRFSAQQRETCCCAKGSMYKNWVKVSREIIIMVKVHAVADVVSTDEVGQTSN